MPEYFQILKPLQIHNRLLLGGLTVPIFSFCCFYHVLTGRHFIIISCWLSKTLSIFQIFFLSLSSWLCAVLQAHLRHLYCHFFFYYGNMYFYTITKDINPFYATGLFLYLLKISEKVSGSLFNKICRFFRGYRKRPVARNRLNKVKYKL